MRGISLEFLALSLNPHLLPVESLQVLLNWRSFGGRSLMVLNVQLGSIVIAGHVCGGRCQETTRILGQALLREVQIRLSDPYIARGTTFTKHSQFCVYMSILHLSYQLILCPDMI